MRERIVDLLEKYFKKGISAEERQELFNYVRDERNEALFKSTIEQYFDNGEEEVEGKEEIYEAILSQNSIRKAEVRPWRRIAGYAAVAAAMVFALTLWTPERKYDGDPHSLETVGNHETAERRVYTQRQQVTLPDGSTVFLKPDSELEALYEAGRFTREVILKGEAFFDIKHDAKTTFVVYTGKISTKVLGTAFYIKALPDQTEVTVTRGLVEVSGTDRTYGKLRAKDQLTIHDPAEKGSILRLSDLEMEAFRDALLPLVFEEASLGEVIAKVGEKFGQDIAFENEELLDCRISADFTHGESLEDILGIICQMRHASYRKEGKGILITGGKLCN